MTVKSERRGAVAILRLDRPDRRNAMDSALLAALLDALADLRDDPELCALVISTTDTRALSAGADVGEALDAAQGVARMERFTELYAAIDAFPVPTVAVMVGNVVGAGAELAAGCDLRVAGDNLKLGWVGARLGVPVGPARLVPLVGVAHAKELLFSGRVLDGDAAVALGLATECVPAADAEATALEHAERIATGDPASLRALKTLMARLDGSAQRVAVENETLLAFQREGAGLPRRPEQR